MTARVLIIGGYGNFGSYIAQALKGDAHIRLILGGRSLAKAQCAAAALGATHRAEGVALDIHNDLAAALTAIAADIVIHTTGPFQTQGYGVAEACIAAGCHYIDLADARAFVTGFDSLDDAARSASVLAVTGASSVPCLTAALIDEMLPRFARLETLDYGISAAQHTNRGLATTSAVLSYVGKPFTRLERGTWRTVYGWQDLHAEHYPGLGIRLFGDCDIPDLALFPARYPDLQTIRFSAGHELKILHLATWVMSWAVRIGLVRSLSDHAQALLTLAFQFDRFGSGRSGFHMYATGIGVDGATRVERFFLIARSGHGPYIPCMPAIILARELAAGRIDARGAQPCLDLIGLDTYMAALDDLDIETSRTVSHA